VTPVSTRGSFPDAEAVTLRRLAPLVGGLSHVGNSTPADLQSRLPFHRVTRVGGADDRLTDFPAVDVDTYAATRSEARRAAEQARDLLTSGPWRDVVTDDAGRRVVSVIDGVDTDTGPFIPPASSQGGESATDSTARGVVRFTASYTLRARRTSA